MARRDRTTGDEDTVTDAQGSGFRPVLSPDGTKLVYGTRVDNQTGLRIRDLASGEERWLKLPVQRDEQESRYTRDLIPGYAFTPDGKSVLAAYGGKIHRLDVQTGADQVIPFSARVSQPVGSRLNFPIRVDDGPVKARLIQDPEPSPDGKHLAFSALTKLYLMDLPDGKPQAALGRGCARVSPELVARRQVARLRELVARGRPHLEAARRRQGEPKRLTRAAAFYRDPVWSPDGKRIVALRAPRRERVENPIGLGPAGARPGLGPRRGRRRHADQPGPRCQPAALRRRRRSDLRDDAAGPGLDAIRRHRPPHASERHRQDGLFAQRARAGRRDPALARRPLGAGPRHQSALPAGAARRSAARRPRSSVHEPSVPLKKLTDIGADYAAWADGGKTITWAVGASFFRLPFDSVVFPPLKSEEDEKGEDKEKAEAEKKAQKPKPEETRRRRSSGRGTGRAGRSCSAGPRSSRCAATRSSPSGDIVVTDHRIVAVGPRGSVKVPEGAKVIDVAGTTIVPGFVDTHAHWIGDPPRRARHAELELLRQPRLRRDRPAATRRRAPTTCSPIRTWSRPASWSARAPSRPGPASSPTPISSRPRTSKRSSPSTRSTTAPTP